MTHLRDILYLMESYDISLAPESNIQVVDYETGAHFRRDWENYTIMLGGDYYCGSIYEVKELVVISMSLQNGILTFYVDA